MDILTKQRYDRSDIRRLNAINVLDLLRNQGALSRANIASRLGLTRATVSNIVADLLEASLISETTYDGGRAGRPGLLLELNPWSGCMLAVDIDLDRISLLLTNIGEEVLWRESISYDLKESPGKTLEQVALLIEDALAVGRDRELQCYGIGVAWAGLVDRVDGQLAYGPTSGWEHVTLKADWEKRFAVPVFVENEAHAGAIGARYVETNAAPQNFIYISLGVGLAAGVYIDGNLMRGERGFAGQVGHTSFDANGVKCRCGKEGCWLTEIGSSAVIRKLADVGVDVPQEEGAEVDWIDWVAEKAEQGDSSVLKVLDDVGQKFGTGAARLVQAFNPSLIVVGGRLCPLMKFVEPVIKEAILAETMSCMTDPLTVVVSQTNEDQLRGCLATVINHVMENPAIGELSK
ncbi:MAG: ROK family transcriptional regulator [Verrucomicrobiota bacterium]